MKRFRLDIVGKLEDHPRLLRAYGRVAGGEIAMVLRPLEYTGLLVRIGKDGAQQWAPAGDNVPSEWPRVEALIQKNRSTSTAVVIGGPLNNQPFRLRGQAADGDVLTVALDVEQKAAVAAPSDAPRTPDAEVDPGDAVRAIKRLQVAPGKAGSVTFRGTWAGSLVCDEGRPRVELRRKLASYGWLRVTSGPHGWTWSFERQEKWFADANRVVGEPLATLVQAIDAGVAGALGPVQVACRVRDTRRRQALDTDWAQSHPVAEPRDTRNPTDRLRERSAPDSTVAPRSTKPTSSTRGRRATGTAAPKKPGATAATKPTSRKPTSRKPASPSAGTSTQTAKATRASSEDKPAAAPPGDARTSRRSTRRGAAKPPSTPIQSAPTGSHTEEARPGTVSEAASRTSQRSTGRALPTQSAPTEAPAEDAALLAAFSEAVAAALAN